jgi:Ca-activated chloride channel family protein
VGLVAFAGTAFLQCPLTLDYGAARSLLELLNPDLIPARHQPGRGHHHILGRVSKSVGAQPGAGPFNGRRRPLGPIGRGARSRGGGGASHFHHWVWEPHRGDHSDPRRKRQVTGYKKDKNGQTVLSKMDEGALKKLAAKTGGAYFPASQGEVEVTKIIEEIGRMDKKDLDSRVYGQGENHYRWPLAFGLLLLLLEFLWPEVQRHWRRVFQDIRSGRFLLLLLAGGFCLLAGSGPRRSVGIHGPANCALGSKGPEKSGSPV